MNKFVKAAVLTLATAATLLPALDVAHADDWRWRHHRGYRDDGVALGALGLATGVIVGGAIASSNQPRGRVYIDPPADGYYEEEVPVYRRPRTVYREVPVYQGGLEPWTRPWYRYCSDRYRSFNPDTGTFRGYDGRSYFCTAG